MRAAAGKAYGPFHHSGLCFLICAAITIIIIITQTLPILILQTNSSPFARVIMKEKRGHLLLRKHFQTLPASLRPLLSSELLLSPSNVCVYLISGVALLIPATGWHVAWITTCWPRPSGNLDRGATSAWHRPTNQLVWFLAHLPGSSNTCVGPGFQQKVRCELSCSVQNAKREKITIIFLDGGNSGFSHTKKLTASLLQPYLLI